jgi:hypothetical protein
LLLGRANGDRGIIDLELSHFLERSSNDASDGLLLIGQPNEHSNVLNIAIDEATSAVDGVYPETALLQLQLLFNF